MSQLFVRGPITNMTELALEKKRLKEHIEGTQSTLVDELQKIPGTLAKNLVTNNIGKIASVAGAIVLGKTLTSNDSEKASSLSKAASAAGRTGGWMGLAVNAGVFLAGELLGYMRKRKEIKKKKAKGEIIEIAKDKKKAVANLFKS